ncbi:MAG: hypothetical protein DBY30_05855 [Verrucomicrobia bacterium]|nr:MAG: hypothetical protein DBY30_05855 [Verrucomicrobiota bacterium]
MVYLFKRFFKFFYEFKACRHGKLAQKLQAFFRIETADDEVAVTFNRHAAAGARCRVGCHVDVTEFAAVHKVYNLLARNAQFLRNFVDIQHRPPRKINAVEECQLVAFGHFFLIKVIDLI